MLVGISSEDMSANVKRKKKKKIRKKRKAISQFGHLSMDNIEVLWLNSAFESNNSFEELYVDEYVQMNSMILMMLMEDIEEVDRLNEDFLDTNEWLDEDIDELMKHFPVRSMVLSWKV